MRTALLLILALILALGGVLVFGALGLRSDQQALASPAPPEVDSVAMLERFRGGLRIPTISRQPGEGMNDAAFEAFREYLTREYPLIHARLERELVSGHTLLFRWPGRDPSLPAVVLLAHQDVVPVDPGSEGDWLHPPFEAVVDEGFVWARGAMDDKLGLFALIEAVEALLGAGFEPRRTVYIVLGHDEELGGPMGASQVALLLAERRVSVGLVLDEGGAIAEGQIPGMERPVALVGVAEKGYTTLSLEVTSPGGHSSAPPAQTTIGILSAAI
ncbi:MAG: M20/M25/M40 family metallo-hydrolase, partial [Myxococcota bacterium]